MVNVKKRIQRDRLWGIARVMGEFTYNDLSADSKRPMNYVQKAVKDWVKDGFVKDSGRKNVRNRIIFEVIKGGEMDIPPVYDNEGRVIKDDEASPEGLMWRTIRHLRTFNPSDVAMHSNTTKVEVSVEAASKYCQFLLAGGYLRVERKAVPGVKEAVYTLISNTGVFPPIEKRVRVVYDQNTCEIIHTFAVGGVA